MNPSFADTRATLETVLGGKRFRIAQLSYKYFSFDCQSASNSKKGKTSSSSDFKKAKVTVKAKFDLWICVVLWHILPSSLIPVGHSLSVIFVPSQKSNVKKIKPRKDNTAHYTNAKELRIEIVRHYPELGSKEPLSDSSSKVNGLFGSGLICFKFNFEFLLGLNEIFWVVLHLFQAGSLKIEKITPNRRSTRKPIDAWPSA